MTHGDTKNLIESAVNIGQIDKILDGTYCKDYADKAEYLCQMFEQRPDRKPERSAYSKFAAIATAIVNHRVA